MAEKTGQPYSFVEFMPAYTNYKPDLGSADVDAQTRGLAHVLQGAAEHQRIFVFGLIMKDPHHTFVKPSAAKHCSGWVPDWVDRACLAVSREESRCRITWQRPSVASF